MELMQEKDFVKLTFTTKYKNCLHNVVKLYYLGTHVEYGCLNCGATHSERDFFTKQKEENYGE